MEPQAVPCAGTLQLQSVIKLRLYSGFIITVVRPSGGRTALQGRVSMRNKKALALVQKG
jgi:hypothetical protein